MILKLNNIIDNIKSILFIVLGLSIPISVAFSNIIIIALTILWLIEGKFQYKLKEILKNKWMLAIISLVMIYAIGLFWGENDNSIWVIKRVSLLLFFLVLGTFNLEQSTLKRGLICFLTSTMFSAVLAILINFEVIFPLNNYLSIISSHSSLSAFTTYNYHNILLAFSAFICLFILIETKTKFRLLLVLSILIYTYSIFTEDGRAGQLLYIFLFGLYSFKWFKKKPQLFILIITLLLTSNIIFYKYSKVFNDQVNNISEIIKYDILDINNQNKKYEDIRVTHTKHSFNHIKNKPFFGYGTGSYGSILKRTQINNVDEIISFNKAEGGWHDHKKCEIQVFNLTSYSVDYNTQFLGGDFIINDETPYNRFIIRYREIGKEKWIYRRVTNEDILNKGRKIGGLETGKAYEWSIQTLCNNKYNWKSDWIPGPNFISKNVILKHTTPHNNYLYTFFELGLLGLTSMISIFLLQIKSLSNFKKNNFQRILLTLGFMFIMLFDSYLFIFTLVCFYIYFYTIFSNYDFN